MANANTQRVVVTIEDQYLPTIENVAQALRSAGLSVSQVLPLSGTITGEISRAQLSALTEVGGVVAVEPDDEMHAI